VPDDRRLVHCRVTAEGLALLERLDPAVDAADDAALGALAPHDVATLAALLARIREDAARQDAAGERPERDRAADDAPRGRPGGGAAGAHPVATGTS
jgi:hypothetical protein